MAVWWLGSIPYLARLHPKSEKNAMEVFRGLPPLFPFHQLYQRRKAAVAEWYRHRIVAGFVTSSSPVPLKTRHVGQRCTLNPSRAETSFRWCGVVVRRGGASSGVIHVT
ncbi:uncharacterized protein TNCV_1017191 [Trichonephila clavipes]|uniref:Uncharacterized protein n=1 Tax=Trichonephila clavipes TaxID=2585209 RepID=A0A8X6VY93_TRICX|nr:uncharacterized protein TNCV_1017191 [Trichonephila clavipes]